MCLALPGQVIEVLHEEGLRMARVEFGGLRKRICLETLPEARLGDWILVHAGFAIQVLDARAAAESLRLLDEEPAP